MPATHAARACMTVPRNVRTEHPNFAQFIFWQLFLAKIILCVVAKTLLRVLAKIVLCLVSPRKG